LIALAVFGEAYKLQSSSCNLLQLSTMSSLRVILPSTLFSNTLSLCSSLSVRDKCCTQTEIALLFMLLPGCVVLWWKSIPFLSFHKHTSYICVHIFLLSFYIFSNLVCPPCLWFPQWFLLSFFLVLSEELYCPCHLTTISLNLTNFSCSVSTFRSCLIF
jgi:hypothetical protein